METLDIIADATELQQNYKMTNATYLDARADMVLS